MARLGILAPDTCGGAAALWPRACPAVRLPSLLRVGPVSQAVQGVLGYSFPNQPKVLHVSASKGSAGKEVLAAKHSLPFFPDSVSPGSHFHQRKTLMSLAYRSVSYLRTPPNRSRKTAGPIKSFLDGRVRIAQVRTCPNCASTGVSALRRYKGVFLGAL